MEDIAAASTEAQRAGVDLAEWLRRQQLAEGVPVESSEDEQIGEEPKKSEFAPSSATGPRWGRKKVDHLASIHNRLSRAEKLIDKISGKKASSWCSMP